MLASYGSARSPVNSRHQTLLLGALLPSGSIRLLGAACGLVALLVFPASAPGARQQAAGGGPKIGQIRVKGNHHFTEQQIVTASGLHAGDAASQRTLDEAASRLAKTGAFTDVTYQYRARGGSWEADFQVTEAPSFLPCTFDNFLWFSDTELIAAVQRSVPLFDGFLPEGRGMQNEVVAALDAFLDAHHLPGSTAVRPALGINHQLAGFLVLVSDVPMPVVRVDVAGGPLDAAALSEATRGLLEHDYSRHTSALVAHTALTEAYQDEGYLQPKFSEPMPAFEDASGKDTSKGVVVKFTAKPGPRYSWAGVTWAGNQALSGPELTKLLALSSGEIARRNKTLEGWQSAREAFGHLGYITAQVKATPNYDDRAATVRYDVQVTEGPQFVMGELRVDDPSPKAAAELAASWPLQRGQTYDLAAEKEFLDTGALKALAHAGFTRKSLSVERDIHRNTRSVDVLLRTNQ
jgi:outer membrane protein assembly factor BamA